MTPVVLRASKPLLTTALLCAAALLPSCKQQAPATQAAAPIQAAAPDSTAGKAVAYICPMGCEGSASNKPGKCPVCEMELEPASAAKPAASL